jgi:hypothetical protein
MPYEQEFEAMSSFFPSSHPEIERRIYSEMLFEGSPNKIDETRYFFNLGNALQRNGVSEQDLEEFYKRFAEIQSLAHRLIEKQIMQRLLGLSLISLHDLLTTDDLQIQLEISCKKMANLVAVLMAQSQNKNIHQI